MSEHIYVTSSFWSAVRLLAQLIDLSWPALALLAAVAWIWRVRCPESYVALVGGVLVFGAEICHFIVPNVASVWMGAGQPVVDQNPFIYFLYLHGERFGLLVFFLAMCSYHLRQKHHARL